MIARLASGVWLLRHRLVGDGGMASSPAGWMLGRSKQAKN